MAETASEKSLVIRGGFVTDGLVEVTASEDGFAFRLVALDPPVHKVFPDEESGPPGDGAARILARDGAVVCGYVGTEYEPWSRRLTVADTEVAKDHQGRGIGRTLLRHATDRGRDLGAGHVWLEVTHLHTRAIRMYQRLGFAFCGLDTSLYLGTESEGETALFTSLPLDP